VVLLKCGRLAYPVIFWGIKMKKALCLIAMAISLLAHAQVDQEKARNFVWGIESFKVASRNCNWDTSHKKFLTQIIPIMYDHKISQGYTRALLDSFQPEAAERTANLFKTNPDFFCVDVTKRFKELKVNYEKAD